MSAHCGRAARRVPWHLQCWLLAFFGTLAFFCTPVQALTEIEDQELTGITGDGISFVWSDFRLLFAPTSYFEQLGSTTAATAYCSAGGNVAGNQNCWRRGDLRWYGLNVSATGTTVGQAANAGAWNTTWTTTGGNMTQCASAGINGLGCPVGGPISVFAAHDNPYVLRAFDYAGDGSAAGVIGNGIVTYQGVTTNSAWPAGANQTTLEWLAPTQQPYYRLSFWGEIEVGRTGAGPYTDYGLLKSQTIIQGNAAGSQLRFFKFTQTATSPGLANAWNPALGHAGCTDGTGSANATVAGSGWSCAGVDGAGTAYLNRTLGIQYKSYLRGDFRFSVAQTEAAPVLGTPVVFHANEGLYFRNADVYFPIGQPYYQALTINVPRSTVNGNPDTAGNITLEVPLIPNRTAVYTRFYSLLTAAQLTTLGTAWSPNGWDAGYATARVAMLQRIATNTTAYMPDATAPAVTVDNNYFNTHGYARWGDWFICQGVSCLTPTTANGTTNAANGLGRNAWNSSGDGVFFYGLTAYNAYAYRPTAVDVRTGANNNGYTAITYYAGYGNCTAGSTSDYATCGYGGSYTGQGGTGVNPVTSPNNVLPAENAWYNEGASMGSTTTRAVIVVPANSALNLGDSRIESMQLNYLRLTTLGAQY